MRFTQRIRVAAILLVAAVAGGCASGTDDTAPGAARAGAPDGPGKPNIVYVLTDDLASNLVQYMPNVQDMMRQGMTFSNYAVTDTLCCPSRSSILTGKFPHNTGVFTNTAPDGGHSVFEERGNEQRTFATALHDQGYRTAMYGKYMNGFPAGQQNPPVPPGWDQWHVSDNGYPGYDYVMDENGRRVKYGHSPKDYLTDMVAGKAESFVGDNAGKRPFLLEVATFAPHGPYTPAPRDENAFPGLGAPRTPAFDRLPANAPPWLADRQPLTPEQQDKIDKDFRKRAQSVQAVDAMVGRLRAKLAETGQDRNTYFVFNSDNGFHMGEHRLAAGKQTAFDTDVRVPLVVTGPGVHGGRTTPVAASNIDLNPTFQEIGGAQPEPDVDGRSLLPPLHGKNPPDWRTTALIEHHGPNNSPDDPDRQKKAAANPPSYAALRTEHTTYVEYVDGTREFYDRTTDPDELNNTYSGLPQAAKDELHRQAEALQHCSGTAECDRAARPG